MRRGGAERVDPGHLSVGSTGPVRKLVAEAFALRAQPARRALDPVSNDRRIHAYGFGGVIEIDVVDGAFDLASKLCGDRAQRLLEAFVVRIGSGHTPIIACAPPRQRERLAGACASGHNF